ncbi:hypothetical protein DSO57_1018823 [Entomophthora muscae]|uniref:Uncharacterized protein n=1 Tax=Entomophthora muscae TaxID=34485 RepID=A0ACC2TG38_9FUNG|nr:hypothetical protein DSO57_1018823 [Entomophthora muscae]
MDRLPSINYILSITNCARAPPSLPNIAQRSPEDDFQLSRFKLDFTPSPLHSQFLSPSRRMSSYQSDPLEHQFQKPRFISSVSKNSLASHLDASQRKAQVWSQTKRRKLSLIHY